MTPPTSTEFAIAAATNVLTLRALAAGLGAPGWVGGMVAAASMAIAADPEASPELRSFADFLSTPGSIAVQVIRDSQKTPKPACCPSCGNGQICEGSK